MSMAHKADWKPIPATRIEPVMAPVMIIGNPSHTIDTENVLRRAWAGTGLCSYSSPSTCSMFSMACSVELSIVIL